MEFQSDFSVQNNNFIFFGLFFCPDKDDIDFYFFGHERKYKEAIKDYTLIGGKIAMVPRYALGN